MERHLIVATCLGVITALSNLFPAIAVNPSSSSVTADDSSTAKPARSQVDGKLAQRNQNCRVIVADGFIPFNNRAASGNALGNLANGDKVELSNGINTILGVDGRSYIGVRIPYIESSYNRPIQQSGYIPTRYQSYGGEMKSTLRKCIRAMW